MEFLKWVAGLGKIGRELNLISIHCDCVCNYFISYFCSAENLCIVAFKILVWYLVLSYHPFIFADRGGEKLDNLRSLNIPCSTPEYS